MRLVEVASALLMQAGQPGHAIRTERFRPTGTWRCQRCGAASKSTPLCVLAAEANCAWSASSPMR